MQNYADVGVTYYVIYQVHSTSQTQSLRGVSRLVNGAYVLQSGEPFWMPEIGQALQGRDLPGLGTRWLYWYDQKRLPSLEERTALTEQELEHERQRTEQAATRT